MTRLVEMGLGPVEIDARRPRSVSRLSRSGSAANSSSSRLDRLLSRPLPRAHNARAAQLPPRLDLAAARRKQARAMRLRSYRRSRRPRLSRADKKESAGALLRFVLIARDRSPGRCAASSSRRSASRPARCCRRSTSATICSSPNGPTAIRATAFRSASRHSTAGSSAAARSAATWSSSATRTENADLIKRVIGLPGDTVAVRGGQLILNGQPVPRAAAAADRRCAVSAEQPVPSRCRRPRRRSPATAARPICLYPRLSRDAARRAELHGARPGRRRAGGRLRPVTRARRATSS